MTVCKGREPGESGLCRVELHGHWGVLHNLSSDLLISTLERALSLSVLPAIAIFPHFHASQSGPTRKIGPHCLGSLGSLRRIGLHRSYVSRYEMSRGQSMDRDPFGRRRSNTVLAILFGASAAERLAGISCSVQKRKEIVSQDSWVMLQLGYGLRQLVPFCVCVVGDNDGRSCSFVGQDLMLWFRRMMYKLGKVSSGLCLGFWKGGHGLLTCESSPVRSVERRLMERRDGWVSIYQQVSVA